MDSDEQIYLGYAYARVGRGADAKVILRRLERGPGYVSPAGLAILHAVRGETDQAFARLERAYAAHDVQLQYLGSDALYDGLRGDPRYADLVRRDHPPPVGPDRAWDASGEAARRGLGQEVRMDWMKQVGDVLNRYQDAPPNRPPDSVHSDFDLFAQNAPPSAVSEGLAAAFRSEDTPEFSQMASQLFGRASGSQKSAMLNMLLATVGPMVLQQILARRQRGPASGPATGGGLGGPLGGGGGLGDILGNILRGGGTPKVTPDVADQIPADVVEEVAREAEKKDPSIIDRVSDIYAQQPQLLKVLGGAALAIALGRMAQKRNTL